MEDYTYDLSRDGRCVLGSHMLEVCPSIAAARPSLRDPPALDRRPRGPRAARVRRRAGSRRSCSRCSTSATASGCVANEIDGRRPPEPTAEAAGRAGAVAPKPDFATATEAWLAAGGPHHTVFSAASSCCGSTSDTRIRDFATSCAGTRPTTGWRRGSEAGAGSVRCGQQLEGVPRGGPQDSMTSRASARDPCGNARRAAPRMRPPSRSADRRTLDQVAGTPDILDPESRELPGPTGQLAERRNRRGVALAPGEQVIELNQNIR
jgi:hypothetical protein